MSDREKSAFSALFDNVGSFRRDLEIIRSVNQRAEISHLRKGPADYFDSHYVAVKSLETYLRAVSTVSRDFSVSPYNFSLAQGGLETDTLETAVDRPPFLLDYFLTRAVAKYVTDDEPRAVGLSCIGQEQLYFTLQLGAILKQRVAAPIFVGGTIFSRIFERGALKPEWFGKFFDIIVRNEGEKPCELLLSNLASGKKLTDGVPGIVHVDCGRVVSSSPCPPLTPAEIPVPDFDDMPLQDYLSGDVTLPLLASRGCYWGKCEFCHHGMVYGEKYAGYDVIQVFDAISYLSDRYGVQHFAFNDEAIPPKVLRRMGEEFPSRDETGWSFTGLIKFENFFQSADFSNAHRIGFRSLYVGLESASERVLRLMRKNNTNEVVARNLSDAVASGIWMHCFLFFGFPGRRRMRRRKHTTSSWKILISLAPSELAHFL